MLVGNWLLGPTDESALTWTIINITTGEERLTNDILGEPFEQPPVPLIQPWTDTTQTPMIIAFSGAPERSPSTIVLLSADLDDAYALNPNHAFAGGNGVITADGSRIAYISPDNTVNVLDGFTGELISQHPLPETDDIYRVVGLTSDDSTLILRDNQQVWTVDLASGELTSIFDPAGFIESFEFDKTTSTIIASAGDRQQPSFFWIDPASGTVKPLDITRPSGNPFPAFGWALIQTQNPDQFGVSYTLLDMTTGETDASWSAIGDDNDANVTIVTITGGGNDPAGIFVVQSELGTMIVLDGPAGRGFEIALPDDGSRRRINTAIGVSPSGGCIVYTEVAQPGEDQGTSWIAPLEPDAEWTKLRFELSGWWEPVEPAPAATPAPDLASPVATPDL